MYSSRTLFYGSGGRELVGDPCRPSLALFFLRSRDSRNNTSGELVLQECRSLPEGLIEDDANRRGQVKTAYVCIQHGNRQTPVPIGSE